MGGLFVSGRYRVSDRFRSNMLNTAIIGQIIAQTFFDI